MATVLDERPLAESLGAADYLIKPIDRDELRRVIEDLSSRANVRDLAREWLERGGQDPSRSLGMTSR
jgi:DNA-binding response OmpR family regulator